MDSPDYYPVLTSDAEKKVHKVTFQTEEDPDYAARYANLNGTVELPAEPMFSGMKFAHWSQTKGTDGVEFKETTQVTGDITVYAVGQKTFGGESWEIQKTATYGYLTPLTVDLDDHMYYGDDTSAAGRFLYTISDNGGVEGASTDGSTLTIPTGLPAKDYAIVITAKENDPEYSLMSAASFGTDPVTLTVKVTIEKANPVVTEPTGNTLIYTGEAQELVEAGSAIGGTMQYSLDQNGSYSTTIPTGTEAKEYTVWYKVVGDDNYNDVEANSIRVTIDKGEANVTGDSVNVIYGNDITLTVNVALKASNGIMLASATENQVVFTFPKDGKTETRMVATGGGTVEIEIPAEQVKDYFNPGLNEVTVSYGGSGNLDTGNAKISVTVGKKPLDFKFKAEDRAYNGSNVVTGTLEMDTELVGNDNVTATPTATVASENASAKPVDVMVNVTLGGADAEYYNVGTVTGGTVTINKAIIGLVTTPALANLTYNGTEQVLLSDSASGVPEGATISYYVGADGGSTAPDGSESGWGELESIKAKDVGTYTVWYKIDGGTNYENVGPTEIGEATIGKKPVKLTWKGYDGLAYTGKPVNVTAEFADGEIVSSDKDDVTVSVSGGDEIEANPGETYTATATLGGDRAGNYTLSNSTQTYTIQKAVPTVEVPILFGKYGDGYTVIAFVSVSGVDTSLVTGTVQFKSGSTTLGTAEVKNGTASLLIFGTDRDKQHVLFGTDGRSTVTAEYSGNNNIGTGGGGGFATVTPRTLKYDVTAAGRVYVPGNTAVAVTLAPKNLIGTDDVTLTAKGNLSSADAGTYDSVSLTEITMGGADAKYYAVSSTADNVTLTSPVTISQAKAIVETPPTGNDDLIYNGKLQSLLSVGGTSVGGTMQYTVGEKDSAEQPNETAEWKENIADITATNAGTYTIWYRANGDVDYATSDLGSITVTIGKATSTVTVQPVTGTYGEDIIITTEVTVPGVDLSLVTGTIEFTDGGTPLGSATVQNGTATLTIPGTDREKQHVLFGTDGSSSIAAVYGGNDNINEGTGNGAATIGPRTLEYDVTATDRAYEPGKTEVEVTLTPKNLIGTDDVTLTAKGSLSSADAGTYESVRLTDIIMSGEDVAYYAVATSADDVPLTTPVTISKIKAKVETPPTGNEDLIYNGKSQSLLSG